MRASLALLAGLLLGACGSAPAPADPPRLRAALEAESDGARRHERGDHTAAARRFAEAARQFAAIDDGAGAARNRLHLARTELARDRPEAALAALADADPEGNSFDALLLAAQANLALDRGAEAERRLAAAAALCGDDCPRGAGLRLLQGHAALAGGHAERAAADAGAALELLRDSGQQIEIANAWRLLAAAQLAAGRPGAALASAEAALAIDRRLALPGKIARDWLLIGDARTRVGAGDTAAAYARALDVARAGGLDALAARAAAALDRLPARPAAGR